MQLLQPLLIMLVSACRMAELQNVGMLSSERELFIYVYIIITLFICILIATHVCGSVKVLSLSVCVSG